MSDDDSLGGTPPGDVDDLEVQRYRRLQTARARQQYYASIIAEEEGRLREDFGGRTLSDMQHPTGHTAHLAALAASAAAAPSTAGTARAENARRRVETGLRTTTSVRATPAEGQSTEDVAEAERRRVDVAAAHARRMLSVRRAAEMVPQEESRGSGAPLGLTQEVLSQRQHVNVASAAVAPGAQRRARVQTQIDLRGGLIVPSQSAAAASAAGETSQTPRVPALTAAERRRQRQTQVRIGNRWLTPGVPKGDKTTPGRRPAGRNWVVTIFGAPPELIPGTQANADWVRDHPEMRIPGVLKFLSAQEELGTNGINRNLLLEVPLRLSEVDLLDLSEEEVEAMDIPLRTHWQMYLEFNKPMLRSEFIEKLHWEYRDLIIHAELRYGTQQQAIDYTKKEDTAVPGTYVTYGTPGEQDQPTSWAAAKKDMMDGSTFQEMAVKHTRIATQYASGLSKVIQAIEKLPQWRNVEVFVYWGDTGTGKTRGVYDREAMMYQNIDIYSKIDGQWWCGYEGQKTIMFDEFTWDSYKLQDMLKWLDGHPLRVNVRHGTRVAVWTRVYICTNTDPSTWYPRATPKERAALWRRIPDCNVIEFRTGEAPRAKGPPTSAPVTATASLDGSNASQLAPATPIVPFKVHTVAIDAEGMEIIAPMRRERE